MATGATTHEKSGQSGGSIEEVVRYAISNRTRAEILVVLNQGTYCASELSGIIGEPINSVSNHLKALEERGAIEIAESKRRRNFEQHFYRAIEPPTYTEEDLTEMHPFERQMTVGFHVQALLAEVMAAFSAGKLSDDPNHILIWDRLNVDEQGRREVTAEQERHFGRLAEIEAESLVRAAGGATTPYIVAAAGFERARKAPVAP